ncbi:MAG: phosphatidic acid phosphatase [Acidobacteria bacterium]|nr:MAG: phosphatidic acid phosphatase [Acidobacteriota bacterium]
MVDRSEEEGNVSAHTGGPPDPAPPRDRGVTGELRADRNLGGRDLTHWRSRPGRWLAWLVEQVSRVLGARQTLVLILTIGVAVAATMTWLASETYEAVVQAQGVALWDEPLLEASIDLRSPAVDTSVTAYTDVGGVVGMPVLAVSVMCLLAIRRRSWTPVILVCAAGLGSLLMTIAGKDLVGRARPPLTSAVPPYEYSPSFPSGHTLNAVVIAGVLAYLVILRQRSRRARALTVALATLFAVTMGLSRVFLGHHWFTDVLAAWVLGLAWLAVVVTAHRLYLTTRKRRVPHGLHPDLDGPP